MNGKELYESVEDIKSFIQLDAKDIYSFITNLLDNDSSKDIDHVINKDYTEINGDIDVLYNYTESKEGHKDNTTIIGTNTIVLQPYNIDINIV